MIPLRTCPTCGSRALQPVHGSVQLRIKRRQVTIPDLDFMRCGKCGEQIFDSEANRKIDDYFSKQLPRPTRRKSA
jgi:YgiT-type zinc finger domain-containing protein